MCENPVTAKNGIRVVAKCILLNVDWIEEGQCAQYTTSVITGKLKISHIKQNTNWMYLEN